LKGEKKLLKGEKKLVSVEIKLALSTDVAKIDIYPQADFPPLW
jgi:hypothetical protein